MGINDTTHTHPFYSEMTTHNSRRSLLLILLLPSAITAAFSFSVRPPVSCLYSIDDRNRCKSKTDTRDLCNKEECLILKRKHSSSLNMVLSSSPTPGSLNCHNGTFSSSSNNDPYKVSQQQRHHNNKATNAKKNKKPPPALHTLTTKLNQWSKSSSVNAPHRAELALRTLDSGKSNHRQRKNNDERKRDNIQPDAVAYTAVMNGYAQRGLAHDAKRLLQSMKMKPSSKALDSDSNNPNIVPDVVTISTVLNAYAKSNDRNAGPAAEALFREMLLPHEDQDANSNSNNQDKILPNAHCYNALIETWGKSPYRQGVRKAAYWLQDMEQREDVPNPTIFTYNTLLNVYAKRNNIEKAMELLERMEEIDMVDVISYTTIIPCIAKSTGSNYKPSTQNNEQGKGVPGNLRGVDAARAILEKIQQNRPHLQPDVMCYNTILNAYAQSFQKEDAIQAEQLLRNMTIVPDVQCYTCVVSAYARCGMSNEAESFLMDYMIRERNVKPNTRTWTALITAIGNDPNVVGKSEKAVQIFKNMDVSIAQGAPTIFTYTAVLNACASTTKEEEKDRAWELTKEMFHLLMDIAQKNISLRPTHITYSTLFKACANLSTLGATDKTKPKCEKDEEFMDTIWKNCREGGHVSSSVLRFLKSSITEEMYRNWVVVESMKCNSSRGSDESENENDDIQTCNPKFGFQDIPKKWKRNVKANNYMKSQKHSNKQHKKHR